METLTRTDLLIRARRDPVAARLLEVMGRLDRLTVEHLGPATGDAAARTAWTSRDVHAIVVETPCDATSTCRIVFGPLSAVEDRRQVGGGIRIAARPVWYILPPATPYPTATCLRWRGALDALADMLR